MSSGWMTTLATFAALAIGGGAALEAGLQDEGAKKGGQEAKGDMAEMMKAAAKFTGLQPEHDLLKRFLGDWEIETRFFMGDQATKPEAGTASASWQIDGRWLRLESSGTLMGQQAEGFLLLGYDPMKKSYVTTLVGSMDNAMLRAEGDLTQDGKALILYGQMDEYLNGEHDKMVKYVFRFVSDDEIRFEVHDLAIGETNTKVIEVKYTRQA